VTTVFVTHDQEEALDLADRVAILRGGELIQAGAPQALYEQPANAFVYEFLGPACRLEGVVEGGLVGVGDWVTPAPRQSADGPSDVYFRPDEIEPATDDGPALAGEVRAVFARGPDLRIACQVDGQSLELHLRVAQAERIAVGEVFRFRPRRPIAYPRRRA